MRLSELAKELNTSSRDLLKQAKGLGLEVVTYISVLESDDETELRSQFRPRSTIEIADDEAAMRRALEAKREAASLSGSKTAEKNAEALQAAIAYAKKIQDARNGSVQVATPPPVEVAKSVEVDVAPVPEVAPVSEKKVEVEAAVLESPPPLAVAPVVVAPPVVAPLAVASPVVAPIAVAPIAVAPVPVVAPVTPRVSRAETPSLLKSLPQRPMQDPRPEVSVQQAVPVVKPSEKPVAVPVVAETPTAESKAEAAKAAVKKDKRPPRPMHPVDEEDEVDVLPRSLSKVVQPSPARTTPTRRGEEHDALRGARDKRGRLLPARQDQQRPGSEQESPLEANVLRLHGPILVKDLAVRLGTRPNIIITELMKVGVLASINQSVDPETATRIAGMHGFTVEQEKSKRSVDNRPVMKSANADDDIPEDRPDQLIPRPPVVTFLGHVDHGKTSLMDRIRSSHVVAGEAGGITQHIAAYTVDVNGQLITFLDTPGHAAFSAMRARGANLTDIAVIIIAADDGIMPQTKEAIKHARTAGVTIMIAINKCDLPQANAMRVMQQLQSESLTPEEWGGDTVVCQVSATTGDGVGNLLDMILLQSEVLELTANPERRANGTVIEAEMKPGSGPIASVLVTGGTLTVGDVMLCGEQYGRVRAIIDSNDRRVKSLKPSEAGRVMGLSGVPEAGAEFRVMINEKRARDLASEFAQRKKEEMLGGVTKARSVDDIFKKMHEADTLELGIILRADVQGSVEAVCDSILQVKSEKVVCNIIQASTGAISSNDVQRAANSNAVIIGFNVSPESGVNSEARHSDVRVRTFRIIYELLDYIKQEMLELIPVEHREILRGHAQVKQVFTLNHVGVAAGSMVTDGVITMAGKARVLRNKKLIHTGGIASIRHFKDEVKEVTQAQECGILLSDFEDFQENDVIECFSFEELPKTL